MVGRRDHAQEAEFQGGASWQGHHGNSSTLRLWLRIEPGASYMPGKPLPLSHIPSLPLETEWVLHGVD